MKKMRTLITDLHYDLLKIIMLYMVKASEGAVQLARTISVCRDFMDLADDEDVLRAANFDSVELSDRYESYQCTNGLIYKCAQAGSITAQYVLAKIILAASSQLWDMELKDALYYFEHVAPSYPNNPASRSSTSSSVVSKRDATSSFVALFMADEASISNRSGGRLIHSQLVRLFLCSCSPLDLVTMRPHLEKYIKYFVGSGRDESLQMFDVINAMFGMLRAIVDLGMHRVHLNSKRKLIETPKEFAKGTRECCALLMDLGERLCHYLVPEWPLTFNNTILVMNAPSGSRLEELKRECKDLAKQLISAKLGKGKSETNAGFSDLGEAFYNYLAQKRIATNGEGSQGNCPSSHYGFGLLKIKCMHLGEQYEMYQECATKVFDCIFPPKYGV